MIRNQWKTWLALFSVVSVLAFAGCEDDDDGPMQTIDPPLAPTGLTCTASTSTQMRVEWDDASNDEDGFLVYRSGSSNDQGALIATLGAGTTAYDDAGLEENTTYHYRVYSYSEEGGTSTGFATASAITLIGQIPASPTTLVAERLSGTMASLAWVDRANNEQGFLVYRGITGALSDTTLVANLPAGSVSYEDNGLNASDTYYYRVVAFNAGGKSMHYAVDFLSTFSTAEFGVIEPFMGTGEAGFGAGGVAPLDAQVYLPVDVGIGPDNKVYVVDWNNHRIRTVVDGVVRTAVGVDSTYGDLIGDASPGPARTISLNHPTHISFNGGYGYIAAWHNSKTLRWNLATDFVEPIAGTGARNFGGDGGPATTALLDLPAATVVDAAGQILISDQANQRVRRIATDGIITTVVGTGVAGFAGDGGPALSAQVSFPGSPRDQSAQPAARIELDADGNLYIADTNNQRVRKVDTSGMITTIAGNGTRSYSGDGGPATAAALNRPRDIAIDEQGSIYIADSSNHCIRRVDAGGTITTFVGTPGVGGNSGDGGSPAAARLNQPFGIALDLEGNLYIADTVNNRIRVVLK